MLCYSGVRFKRIYTESRDKRAVWKAYVKSQYCYDFDDLRHCYEQLFENWYDESKWESAEVFVDSNY